MALRANDGSGAVDQGSVIGEGSMLEGALEINHCVRVEGCLRGKLNTSETMVVGTQGKVIAELMEVSVAIIKGRVWGKLKATTRVYLSATSEFLGSVETPHLVMEEGANAQFCSVDEMADIPEGWGEDGDQAKTTLREFPTNAADDETADATPEGELARGD